MDTHLASQIDHSVKLCLVRKPPGEGFEREPVDRYCLRSRSLLAMLCAATYFAEEPYVTTDDAFVRAAKEFINSRVAGQAIEVAVKDNQYVTKGQLLFGLIPSLTRSRSIRRRLNSVAYVFKSAR